MKYEAIIGKLDLEQKCTLLSGMDVFRTRAFPEMEIPSIWLSDGPHGLRKQAGPSDHLGLNPSEPATCFPPAATVACSWNLELGEEIGAAIGEEAAAQGVNVVLGPGLNMKRNPLCGRNFEYFSEDPYFAGKMAAAYIRGIQENGVAACPKHFAANNQETRRMASDSIVDERTLREIYLTGFEIAVKEAAPKCIMTSYNRINGVYANENEHLLQDILKRGWGYNGAVVTDWGGSNDHALGVAAGSTLEMPAPGGDSVRELMAAVQSGKISEKDVDDRLEELLELVFSTDNALHSKRKDTKKEEHHALAYRAAAESLTLLKNDDNILPLASDCKVAVIGDFAETPRYQGAGSSLVNATKVDSILACMSDTKLQIIGYEKGFERLGKENAELLKNAVELAQKADKIVLCLGLDEVKESEGLDRKDMKLASNQLNLLHAIKEVNPNIIVVLSAGSAVETAWRADCKALLYIGLCGQAGAGAVTDALTGKCNPGGKLAETWPEHYEDCPTKEHFAGKGRNVEYREGLYIGYRYYQKAKRKVAFPFGYGLSYTQFEYSHIKADENCVTFTITNVGKYEGAEIAQIYVSAPGKQVFCPVRELKGFVRVQLKAGESKTVCIPLDDKAFRYWNVKTNQWETEGGIYRIGVGASAEDIRLSAQISIEGTNAPAPYELHLFPHYCSGMVQDVTKQEYTLLLGHELPKAVSDISRNMTIGEINHGRSPIGWLAWLILSYLLKTSMKKGHPDLNLMFIYNMPLRGLAKMTGGIVSMGMVDGMVMELKGFWIIGIMKILLEYVKNKNLNKKMV